MGMTDSEITEHSIRKVIECIVQDFPVKKQTETNEAMLSPNNKSVDFSSPKINEEEEAST